MYVFTVMEGGREGERDNVVRRFCQKGRAEKAITQTTLEPNRPQREHFLLGEHLQDGVGMRMRRQDVPASRSQRIFCQQHHVRQTNWQRIISLQAWLDKNHSLFLPMHHTFLIIMLTFPRTLPPQRQIVML